MDDLSIIKAIENCIEDEMYCSEQCPMQMEHIETTRYCMLALLGKCLDLINRKDARIGELEAENERLLQKLQQVKSEAYREFAHMVVDKAQKGIIYAMDIPDYVVELTKSNE